MITYKFINNNESGLSVRTKLNEMFFALINGTEGVNNIWKKLSEGTSTDIDGGNAFTE